MMNYEALDEALAYLNGEDTEVVNESIVGIIGTVLMIPYIVLMALLFLSLPSMMVDGINRNKLFNGNKKFFDALNKFAYKYANCLKKEMPKFGKYINPSKISGGKDINRLDTKEKLFSISALSFDLDKLKKDTTDIDWNIIHKIYEYYGDEFEGYEDSIDDLDGYSEDFDVDFKDLKSNWNKVCKLKNEVKKEYYNAVKKVREYFDINGCPAVISFELFGNTDGDEEAEHNDFSECFLSCIIYSGKSNIRLGYITVHYDKGLDRVKMPEELRKEIKSKIKK